MRRTSLLGGMSIRYEISERAGKTVDVLTDDATGTRLTVARLGAEPISLARRGADGHWTGFLWRDDDFSKNPDGWNNHATVMGYYLHRILNGRTTYRGHEIVGGTHSFLRHKTFPEPIVEISDARAALTYVMLPSGYEPREYPFRVLLALTYSLEADGAWRVRFRFQSQEPELTTHVSFGLHPGFAVGSMAEAQVLLPPGQYRRHLAPGDYLSGETVTIDHPGGPMPFDKKDLPGSFLLEPLAGTEKVFTLVDPAGGRRVEVHCPQAPYLTLWSDGHPFICVEPCWGLPDAHAQLPFEDKEGIQVIAPDGVLEREFSVRATLA